MKTIINFLRKIGLLRMGVGDNISGEYGNRGTFKKEEKSEEDSANLKGSTNENKKASTGMFIFWLLVFLVAIFLLVILIEYSFSFWWLIFFIIWVLFFRSFKKALIFSGSVGVKWWIIFFISLIFSWIFLIPNNKSNNNKGMISSNKGDLLVVNQANFSSFIFGSNSRGEKNPDTVNLIITPMLNLSLSNLGMNKGVKLKNLQITKIKFVQKPAKGEVKIIAPSHQKIKSDCSGFFFNDCKEKINPKQVKSNSGSINYAIVDNGLAKQKYYDEVGTGFINPQFKVLLYHIGTVDYKKIMAQTGSFNSGKLADYAKVKASDLKSSLEFDLVASFSNGDKQKKHLVVNFNGQDLLTGKTVKAE